MRSLINRVLLALLALALIASCGKKGPPRLTVQELPAVPQELSALQLYSPREVLLTWRQAGRAEGFSVMRSEGEEFHEIASVSERTFTDTGLDDDTTYVYRVVAIGPGGDRSGAAESVSVAPVAGLAAPESLSAIVEADHLRLDWQYPGEANFNVYFRTEGQDYALRPANAKPLGGAFFKDEPRPGQIVHYMVRAVVPGQRVRTEGPPSGEVSVAPEDYVPRAPAGLDFARGRTRVLLFWKENPEDWVRGYRVYRAPEGGEFEAVGESRTPAFEDREPLSAPALYRITALGPAAESQPSETMSVGE